MSERLRLINANKIQLKPKWAFQKVKRRGNLIFMDLLQSESSLQQRDDPDQLF